MDEQDRLRGIASRSSTGIHHEPSLEDRRREGPEYREVSGAGERSCEALEKLTDTFMVLDDEGRLVSWNHAVNELTGLSDDQLLSCKPEDFFPQPEAVRVRQTIEKIRELGHGTLETWLRVNDGSLRSYELSGDLLKDPEGRFSSICVVGRDVTEREAAEEKIRRQHQFLQNVLESLPHPFYVIDASDHTVIVANSAACSELVPGKTACHARHNEKNTPCDTFADPCFLEEVKKTGCPYQTERILCDEHGNCHYWEVHAYPLFDLEGRVTQIIVDTFEITDRKRMEQMLAEKEEQYRHLTEGSLTGMYIHQDGLFVYVNQRLADMLGCSVEEMVDKPFWDFVHPEDRDRVKQRGMDRYKGKQVVPHYEFRALSKSGETRWHELSATTITYRGRSANMGNVADITERKRVEQEIRGLNEELERRVADRTAELEALNRELKDFAYVVSHDLRAPLRGINQLATWIREDYFDCFDEEGREQISLLLGRVKRMENLIEGILQYSRVGRIKEERQPIDVEELVRQAGELVSPLQGVRVIIENKLPTLEGEPTRLRQVFQNLIDNAAKFMDKPQGEIRIACHDENSHWRFTVSDNGPGIDRKHHERIFQMFQTLESRDRVEGTGIGLALVKKIVESSGGSIRVTSEVGTGTTFHVSLLKG